MIDLRSDTVTRPSREMRHAMAEAEVGDHVLGDDPTAARLEEMAAELLGKERALFFPSGIMANQAAIHLHARPGTDGLVIKGAHVLHYEEGAASAWSGVRLREIGGRDGEVNASDWAEALRESSRYAPEISLVSLENTHNSAGGTILSPEVMANVSQSARSAGVPVHLDGARLVNASVAASVPMSTWADYADTVMMSLSKGLGAPVGSMLAGSDRLMEQAWRIRRRMGGGMRQTGILAAAGIYALDHNLERIAEDHRRAADFGRRVNELGGFRVAVPQTNIVMVECAEELGSPGEVAARLAEDGVLLVPFGGKRLRAVFHLDVDDEDVDRAVRKMSALSVPSDV